jgi:transposase-like protein
VGKSADRQWGESRVRRQTACCPQVTKAVLERALAEEMTEHLGYEKHDPAGRGSGNSRNGTTGKTLISDDKRAGQRPNRASGRM